MSAMGRKMGDDGIGLGREAVMPDEKLDVSTMLARAEDLKGRAVRGFQGLAIAAAFNLLPSGILFWLAVQNAAYTHMDLEGPRGLAYFGVQWLVTLAPSWVVAMGLRDGDLKVRGCGGVVGLLLAPFLYMGLATLVLWVVGNVSQTARDVLSAAITAAPAVGLVAFASMLARSVLLGRRAARCPAGGAHAWEATYGTVRWWEASDGTEWPTTGLLRAHLASNPALGAAPVTRWRAKAWTGWRCADCGAEKTLGEPQRVAGTAVREAVTVGMTGVDG